MSLQKKHSDIVRISRRLYKNIHLQVPNKEEFSELTETLNHLIKEKRGIEGLKKDPHGFISTELSSGLQGSQEKQLTSQYELQVFLASMGLLYAFDNSTNVSQSIRILGQCLYKEKQVNAKQKRVIDAWASILASLEKKVFFHCSTPNDFMEVWIIATDCLEHLMNQKKPAIFADVIVLLIQGNKLNRCRLDLVMSHKKLSSLRDFLNSLAQTGFVTDENVMIALVGEFTFFFRVLLKFCWLITKGTPFMISWGKRQLDKQFVGGNLPFVLDMKGQPWIRLHRKNLLTLKSITLFFRSNAYNALGDIYLRFGKIDFLENLIDCSDQQLRNVLTFEELITNLKNFFEDPDSSDLDWRISNKDKIDSYIMRILIFGWEIADLFPKIQLMLQDNIPEELKSFPEILDCIPSSNKDQKTMFIIMISYIFKNWPLKRAVDIIAYLKAKGLLDKDNFYKYYTVFDTLFIRIDPNLSNYSPMEFYYLLRISLSYDEKKNHNSTPIYWIGYPPEYLKDLFDFLHYLPITENNFKKLESYVKQQPNDLSKAISLCKSKEGCFLDERIRCLIKLWPNSISNFEAHLFENPAEELRQNSGKNPCQALSIDKEQVMKLPEIPIKPVYAAESCSRFDSTLRGVSPAQQQLLSI